MKIISICILLILLCILNLSAQTDSIIPYKNQIRFSLGWYWHLENSSVLLPSERPIDYMDIGLPAISYIRQIKGNDYHEVSLNKIKFQISRIIGDTRYDDISVGLLYNYNIAFVRKKQSKVNGYLGVGSNLYYNGFNSTPFYSDRFPTKLHTINLKIQCTPRVQFNIKKHWCIDVNIPIELSKFSIEKSTVLNPSLPIRYQSRTIANYQFMPFNLSANIGVGYKF